MYYSAVILPFVVLLVGTLVVRRPLWQSSLVALILAVILWQKVPGMELQTLTATGIRSFILSCEVGLILFGAISFLEYMNVCGSTAKIKQSLGAFTDRNLGLDALLLAWLFCGFIEGVAGFGAPAAIVAPLLVSIGFSPIIAAVIPLIGDSAAVLFGAVGTPVRVGFAGFGAEYAAHYGAFINILAGLVAPLAIYKITSHVAQNKKQSATRHGYLLALWAGLCFTVPAFILVWIGPEFPSLIGSLIGLLLFCITLLKLKEKTASQAATDLASLATLGRAFAPYLFLCTMLLGGKLIIGNMRFSVDYAGSTQTLAAYQPGLIFLIAIGLLALIRHKKHDKNVFHIFTLATQRLPFVWIAIFCIAGIAQLIIQGTSALAPNDGMFLEGAVGEFMLLATAPVAGAIGAFVAGSATVSNILMAPFLVQASHELGVNISLILGLQLVGAGAGNMVSLINLAAVQATVGISNREREMLSFLWKPCLLYVSVAIVIGFSIQYFFV